MAVETVTLADSATGSQAKVLAGFGFNCCQFRAMVEGRPVEVLWSEPGFESGDKRASGSGIPLLFPFAGRIRGQTLRWGGRQWPLEGDDGRGNAIHGFVLGRPWRVIERSDTRVVGQFQASLDEPRLLDCWPADFCITATYVLAGNALDTTFLIGNPSDRPLPCGFGTHPYFRVPLGGDNADACRVELPVRQRWEMVDMLPTGERLPIEDVDRYHAGLPFGEMSLDDVFTGLEFRDDWCTCRIVDPQSGRRLVLEFDRAFRESVVYNPPHREAVCVEPYTCVPNAAELAEQGIDAGLRVLAPDESFQARVVMRVE
jgi:aldose 1-epimerase